MNSIEDARDIELLRRCVALAAEALHAGDDPFGSLLADAEGRILFEDRNRVATGNDATLHPEFEIARWAARNLSPAERATAVVYTSGEHCPMCSAAHAWAGLGRIAYVASSAMLAEWLEAWGQPGAPVNSLPIAQIAPQIEVSGPAWELVEQVKALHAAARAVQLGGQ